ncbi:MULTISPECIES: nucleotide exchange factor GrpE [unclassified Paenibacillus]|uniref:nucleotide exchange factor GrpE n=1 Tax=unclassified Paenibacillus TaxID=185978 RepID=UPI00240703AF|nr:MULTISPECIES: nucleotide exchange factor GrpE [unclassified Paenibacillus]MDF9843308.1 molecular chaperone GrpE [Paenibacillus sp. PastF-2]MDF9849896.1 molecular chaperone GrpE [Paenibacillus sp. PastM-2]MDF9856604.1 molecular chaperone GrpE [Paenibacillus sp. PastF-1]MDH6481873.1 molecular chaperone GrpE [Paenibacillus sp. PastH-2]MDH6509039.1 molecular chaperone GrpE [Paenibacillus sp. PastM-3]
MKEEQVQDPNELKDEAVNEAQAADEAEAAAESTADIEEASDGGVAVRRLQELAEEAQARTLRVQADFDNFRRRTQKEKEELAQYATSKLVTELLPVLDNFERALVTAPGNAESEAFTKGINMIFRQLEGVLKSEGLAAMETVGQPFNPEYHQAIMQVESEEHEEGIVTEEVQKGYLLKDKVLRPAMVKVSM